VTEEEKRILWEWMKKHEPKMAAFYLALKKAGLNPGEPILTAGNTKERR